jgi:transposase
MSKLAELAYDIEQLYIEGYSPKSIAVQLGCTLEMVYGWLEANSVNESTTDAADWDEIDADDFSPYTTSNS